MPGLQPIAQRSDFVQSSLASLSGDCSVCRVLKLPAIREQNDGFDDMPTAAKMELTLKVNEFPADVETIENGWKQFNLDCDGRIVTVKVKPKMFKKLEQAQETYPMWVAAIGGKMGEETDKGFILDEPNIQVFEKKPKPPKEETAAAS